MKSESMRGIPHGSIAAALALAALGSAGAAADTPPEHGANGFDIALSTVNPADVELGQCPRPVAGGGPIAIQGPSLPLGQGEVRPYVTVGPDGATQDVGVLMSEGVLRDLPQDRMFTELELDLPCAAPPYTHVVVDWNRMGHPPEQLFGVPHFDVHFYLDPKAIRHAITCSGDDEARCKAAPAADLVPATYVATPALAPRMGAHWADPAAPELNGSRFEHSLINGFYEGHLAFIEPMVTLEFLSRKADYSEALKQPARSEVFGAYPTSYSIRHDEAGTIDIALNAMIQRGEDPAGTAPPAPWATEKHPELAGAWRVKELTCGGQPANEQARAFYSDPNSIELRIDGEAGAFVDLVGGCRKTIPLAFVYRPGSLLSASFSGPIQCYPAACDPQCGFYPPVTVDYRYALNASGQLELDTLGQVDVNCTAFGQPNPIHYVMEP